MPLSAAVLTMRIRAGGIDSLMIASSSAVEIRRFLRGAQFRVFHVLFLLVLVFSSIFAFSQAQITSPVPNSTLTGSNATFTWNADPNAAAYWIDVGSTAGGHDIYSSGNLGNVLTATVSGLPTDGSTIYVTLYSLDGGQWLNNEYTYTAFDPNSGLAVMQTPVPNSILSGSSVAFTWSAGTSASAYWIDAGSTVGAHDYYSSGNLGNVLTATVNGLPMDGSTVYVTLYSLIDASWQSNAYTYTAYSPATSSGVLTAPTPGSTLSGSTVTFCWSAGVGAAAYWVDIGSTAGGHDIYSSGNLGNVLTTTVNGLPTDGSTVYVTLYSLIAGSWQSNGYTYTAFNLIGGLAVMQTPAPNSTLSGSSVAFTWSAGAGATAYWIDVGSTAGAHDYYSSGNLGNVLTTTANGLPTDGSTVYVTLYSLQGGQWLSNEYTYTAFNVSVAAAVMTTPTPGSTLTGSSVTFCWTAGAGALAYWIDVGSTAGGHDYYSSGSLGNVLTVIVSGLPTNGVNVYVTLYSLVGGTWMSNAYTYTAYDLVSTPGVLTTPSPGSTLTSGTATFAWTAGTGISGYWVDIGSVPGGNSIYSSGNLGNVFTTTVTTLPTSGSTVYVTLYSLAGGVWLSNAYIFNTLVTYPGSTFFIAPNGNDSWNGDLSVPNSNNSDGPFATLSRAQSAVQKAAKPATVIVRNGTYYLALAPSANNSNSGLHLPRRIPGPLPALK